MEKTSLIKWLSRKIEEEIDAEIWANSLGNYNYARTYASRREAYSLVKTVVEGFDD